MCELVGCQGGCKDEVWIMIILKIEFLVNLHVQANC